MGAVRDPSHTALKAVIAAGLAWQLGRMLGHDDVAYFAPITALVAIHPVVASSLRESVQYGLGVLAGVLLAAAVGALVGADLLGVVLVVGVGVLVGALPPFGRNGATTAFWALLVLLVGGTDPASYLSAAPARGGARPRRRRAGQPRRAAPHAAASRGPRARPPARRARERAGRDRRRPRRRAAAGRGVLGRRRRAPGRSRGRRPSRRAGRDRLPALEPARQGPRAARRPPRARIATCSGSSAPAPRRARSR